MVSLQLVLLALISLVAVHFIFGSQAYLQTGGTLTVPVYEGSSSFPPTFQIQESALQSFQGRQPHFVPPRFPGREAVVMGNGRTALLPKVEQSKSWWWPRVRGLFWGQSCTPAQRAANPNCRYR